MLKQDELRTRFDEDEIIDDEVGVWSQVCNKHIVLLELPESQLDRTSPDHLICGVVGCEYDASAYVDFDRKE